MDYLISIQDSINTVNNALMEWSCMEPWRDAKIVDSLHDIPPAQQWTPVSEGLPEENGRYLVTRGLNACGSLWNRVYIVNYSDLMGLKKEKIWWGGNVGKSDFEIYEDVIAWMQLTKPYKEAEG